MDEWNCVNRTKVSFKEKLEYLFYERKFIPCKKLKQNQNNLQFTSKITALLFGGVKFVMLAT